MTAGKKNDVWILRAVAQSKANAVHVKKLTKSANNTSIYATLDRLAPKSYNDAIPSIYLFRHDDFFNQEHGITGETLERLKRKLQEAYNPLLQWKWEKIMPDLVRSNEAQVVIVFKEDNNNFIKINLSNKAEKLAKMTLKIDIIKYGAKKVHSKRQIPIPLVSEKDGKILYFRALSGESYLHGGGYLNFSLDERGQRLISKYESEIQNIWSSNTALSYDEKKKKTNEYKSKISKVHSNRRYQLLSINIRGLLEYALQEIDSNEFDKSLKNLAECDEYYEVRDKVNSYNKFAQPKCAEPDHYFRYSVKKNFPFLSCYSDLKRLLPHNFVQRTLVEVAKQIMNRSEGIAFESWRYKVTEYFFNKINKIIQNGYIDQDNILEKYIAELGAFVGHTRKKNSIIRRNSNVLYKLQGRYNQLEANLYAILENAEKESSKQIIPIYEEIAKAGLPWMYSRFAVSNILSSIEKDYGRKYIVTHSCIMPRSKAKELKSLLKCRPTYDKACLYLLQHGVPKQCIDGELFYNLGYITGFEDVNHSIRIIVPKQRKHNITSMSFSHAPV